MIQELVPQIFLPDEFVRAIKYSDYSSVRFLHTWEIIEHIFSPIFRVTIFELLVMCFFRRP